MEFPLVFDHGGLGSREAARSTSTSTPETPVDLKIPVMANYLFSALAGTCWYFQFFFYDGGNADGQIRFCLVDAAHGQHHHLQHDVGMDSA